MPAATHVSEELDKWPGPSFGVGIKRSSVPPESFHKCFGQLVFSKYINWNPRCHVGVNWRNLSLSSVYLQCNSCTAVDLSPWKNVPLILPSRAFKQPGSRRATGGRTLLKQRHFGFIIKSCCQTFYTHPFSQDTKYMALSHEELAAKVGEICGHSRTHI